MSDALEVGERFFGAIEAGDIETLREIYHPDVVIWHNSDGLERRERGQNREDNLGERPVYRWNDCHIPYYKGRQRLPIHLLPAWNI